MHAMNSGTPDQVRGDDEKYISVVALRRLHNLGQHPAHILGVKEEDQRPMRPDPRLAEHALAHRLELGLGGVNVGDFVTQMMLPARRVLLQESRSEEHTSELQSLMRISYAVFCLKKKKKIKQYIYIIKK